MHMLLFAKNLSITLNLSNKRMRPRRYIFFSNMLPRLPPRASYSHAAIKHYLHVGVVNISMDGTRCLQVGSSPACRNVLQEGHVYLKSSHLQKRDAIELNTQLNIPNSIR